MSVNSIIPPEGGSSPKEKVKLLLEQITVGDNIKQFSLITIYFIIVVASQILHKFALCLKSHLNFQATKTKHFWGVEATSWIFQTCLPILKRITPCEERSILSKKVYCFPRINPFSPKCGFWTERNLK